ncbi:MAG: glycosyl transferase family 36 [Pseudanabaenaceae cyanobacterium bins.68]|nr:glycosyl transferase family 36 [Pseudanabaenaceae cyanobacterium bins.68]
MNYGSFSPDGREFIISEPRTPRPWFNYIWNGEYTGLISHTGGGFSFCASPRDNRVTRMRYNSLPWDRPGRYVILKDLETGKFWSLSWAPTLDLAYDRYECRHGQGYTQITTEIFGIRAQITYFVPNQINAEVWRVQLTNLSNRDRPLEVYSFVELVMGNALNDLINQPNDKHFTDIHFDPSSQALVATRRYWVLNRGVSVKQPNMDWQYQVHFHQTLPISGFDGSLDRFIGRWRSEANPIAIEHSQMGNSEITAGDPVVALQSRVELAAHQSLDFAVVLEITPKNQSPQLIQNSLAVDLLDQLFQDLHQKWRQYLSHIHAETPHPQFNLSINIWNPYQAAVTFDMARNAGYYHGGLLFGNGIRDQFQDILGMVIAEPARVRSRLLQALKFQFQDGSTLHNFFKFTQTGEKTNHSDTPLWIPFGIVEYLNETGDFSILDQQVAFYDQGQGSVYDHLIQAITYVLSNLSDRGMQKIRNGDWNDTLDYIGPEGKGETVWGTCFLGYILQKVFPLLRHLNDQMHLAEFEQAYEHLQQVLNQFCWDGAWYVRAFRDDRSVVGSHQDPQGQIFLNAQSWAVISGLATPERAKMAIASCVQHLSTPYGMQIVSPSYTQVEDNTGLISRCVPGKKENGAVFNHASSWFVLAAILNNQIELAWQVYEQMLPANSAFDRDRYEVEPYVFAEYVTSPDHPTQGQASHSWLTGTAVWMLRIGLDYILGLRPQLGGMVIDPHIPAAWQRVRVQRKFRGKLIDLTIHNSQGLNSGVQSLRVNGKQLQGNFLHLDPETENLTVEVELGK